MLIGRKKQQKELLDAYRADDSKFVALYGRRRVGKTYLVKQTFKGMFTFTHSGLANGSLKEQLYGWRSSLENAGFSVSASPKHWLEAFDMLKQLVRQSEAKKKVIFIDEMPWLDTPRSKFVTALEFFWNGWASMRDDILLIVCGSATSWIVNKLLRNHGGLHNRVSTKILLQPFTLHECEEYSQSMNLAFSRYELLEAYMVMGGVPYYWSLLERGKSLAQNIDTLFFSPQGMLHYEFRELYDSLFRNPNAYIKVVETLGQRPGGLRREELVKLLGMTDSGNLTRILDDLEHCGFIMHTNAYATRSYNAVYRLTDNFSLFYMKFMRANKSDDPAFWSHSYSSPLHHAWCGLAFERVCFQHIAQIKRALGISGVLTNTYSWQAKDDPVYGAGAQIDMLIDRADNTVNLCEIKFASQEFVIDKEYDAVLRHKMARFSQAAPRRKSLLLTMVTTYGVAHNAYWNRVQSEVVADDLFSE